MKSMMRSRRLPLIRLTILLICVLAFSCKTSPTGPHLTPQDVQLTANFVACKEVWLKVGFTDSQTGGQYKITRDSTDTVLTGAFFGSDTVLIDTTAQAEKSYTYKAYKLVNGKVTGTSLPLQVTTMDTTSGNFTWQSFVFGDPLYSTTFYDAAIISDSLAYVSGIIYLDDSTGKPDPSPYCLAKWDGHTWSFMHLKDFPPGSLGDSEYTDGFCITGTEPNDIWLYGPLRHFDGQSWTAFYPPFYNSIAAQGANEMWYNGNRGLWYVGRSGLIVSFNGYDWHDISSGTTTELDDIWGYYDPVTHSSKVLCTVTSRYQVGDYKILSVQPNATAIDTLDSGLNARTYGIWFDSSPYTFVCGDGIFMLSAGRRQQANLPNDFAARVRGNAFNDVIAVGCCGLVGHYNGSTWQYYPGMPGNYNGLSVRGSTVVAVGWIDQVGSILIGRRN